MFDDGLNLINLQPMADVANNLINKLSDAVGWYVNRTTPSRIALETYIYDIKNSNLSPLEKAAKIYNAKKEIKEYINQYQIVATASWNIKDDSDINRVDDDFIATLMDKARLISNKEFQTIWGKVLATECSNPGTIPKSTLFILERMDRDDAYAFESLCSVSIKAFGRYSPIIPAVFNQKSFGCADLFFKAGITYEKLMQLESLGLIKLDFAVQNTGFVIQKTEEDNDKTACVQYYEKKYILDETETEVPVGAVAYTKDGEALASAVEGKVIDGFWDNVVIPMITTAQRRS